MKKRLNIDSITNELAGASAFFTRETPPPSESSAARTQAVQQPVEPPPSSPTPQQQDTGSSMPATQPPSVQHTSATRTVSTNEQPLKRTFERKKIRHTFDIYYDQLLSLREMALNREMLFGERVLLGDLVQEALDMFITKERNKE